MQEAGTRWCQDVKTAGSPARDGRGKHSGVCVPQHMENWGLIFQCLHLAEYVAGNIKDVVL
jgi:hypothetical protein